MEAKKAKEKAAKEKRDAEDLLREKQIEEEIEKERAIAAEKKRQAENQVDGGKVRFSPIVGTRAEKKIERSPRGQDQ